MTKVIRRFSVMELARLHIYHVLGLSFQKTADVFHNAVQKPLAAFRRLLDCVVENIRCFLEGKPQNVVNM